MQYSTNFPAPVMLYVSYSIPTPACGTHVFLFFTPPVSPPSHSLSSSPPLTHGRGPHAGARIRRPRPPGGVPLRDGLPRRRIGDLRGRAAPSPALCGVRRRQPVVPSSGAARQGSGAAGQGFRRWRAQGGSRPRSAPAAVPAAAEEKGRRSSGAASSQAPASRGRASRGRGRAGFPATIAASTPPPHSSSPCSVTSSMEDKRAARRALLLGASAAGPVTAAAVLPSGFAPIAAE
jgi:hypothetical protein